MYLVLIIYFFTTTNELLFKTFLYQIMMRHRVNIFLCKKKKILFLEKLTTLVNKENSISRILPPFTS